MKYYSEQPLYILNARATEYYPELGNSYMSGHDGFTTPCSSDAPDGGNGSATTAPIVCRRACQDSFRDDRGDSAQTEDIVCGDRSTYGRGASATEGDVWGA